jgi:hypothetical protein
MYHGGTRGVISTSGISINDWPRQLDRIEAVVKKFNNRSFLAEAGCPSVKGSSLRPNDWACKVSSLRTGAVHKTCLRKPLAAALFWALACVIGARCSTGGMPHT